MLFALYLIAISAEAMSAALASRRSRIDLFGVAVIGSIAGLGGGTLRDVLLGQYPLTWVARPWLLLVTAGSALVAALVASRLQRLRTTFLLLDAMGLVVFTLIGNRIALDLGHSGWTAAIFGLITGCAGGVLRDVLCNEVPLLLRRELYASISVIVSALYLACLALDLPSTLATLLALAVGLTLRMLTVRFNWHLPTLEAPGDER
ncbi:trimeric intracellular cation channel family protein [Halotalea alkalilenta]|uniref:trimeric intracellular cation channel family protein n=1 Tax=Halotalea alkalilenta TaxID=376489 RepID=UPI0004862B4C|nr:trimeric intracellular cation channel family protein [Halotalea alkalilenta]